MEGKRALDQQVTRREALLQMLLALIVLVGLTFFINYHTLHSANVANVSKVGAAGAKGQTGATGPQGLQGLTGAAGIDGTQGAKGANGAAGANGSAGTSGAAGSTGTQGTPGAPGAAGTFSSNYASYYLSNFGSPEAVPIGSHWIIGFPTQATSHGSHITVNNSIITLSTAGTYLITASGSVQMPTLETATGELKFNIMMKQSVQGGSYTELQPSPLADYEFPVPDNNTGFIMTQTFNVSRLVTVTDAPTDVIVVLNDSSDTLTGNVYLYDRLVNIVQVD